jgi:hypothetical protein
LDADSFGTAESLILLRTNHCDCAARSGRKNFEKPRHQRTQIVEAVAACGEHDYCDVECGKVVLVGQVAISRQENVEVADREGKKFAVALGGPPHLGGGSHVVSDEIAFQAPGQALVKQDAHGR